MSEIEVRVITPGKYWTVYDRKQYLGAIAYRDGMYAAVKGGLPLGGEKWTLAEAVALFEFPVTQ
jgi:hypothetical protein